MASHNDMSGEDRLIDRFFKPLATHPGALGLSDDAAFITPGAGTDIVLTTDAIIGGVHFFAEDAPQAIACKALRVNLSDLAAKGARPLGFLLSLALPKTVGEEWLAGFTEGLRGDSILYGCPLFGGDTDRTPGPVTISVALFGTLPEGTMVRRAGAAAGDRIYVTGTIGDAALGLRMRSPNAAKWMLSEPQRRHLVSRYLLPQPRNALAEVVAPTPRPRWISPTVSPAILPSFAACRGSGRQSRSQEFRCRKRRGPSLLQTTQCSRRR